MVINNKKIALLTNVPTPYRTPFYNNIFSLLSNSNADFIVYFDSIAEPNRTWGIRIDEFLFKAKFSNGFTVSFRRTRNDLGFSDIRYLQIRFIFWELIKYRPDVVISGEFGLRTIQAIIYKKIFKKKIILWSEGTCHTEGFVGNIKCQLRRWIVSNVDRFWTNGAESTSLLTTYGGCPSIADEGMTGVDTQYFNMQTKLQLVQREQIRSNLGLVGTVFLFVGGFIERKGLLQTIEAFRTIYDMGHRNWSVIFIGEGPLESNLLRLKEELYLSKIHIVGRVDNADLPKYFSISDVFLMPTLDDNWPLAPLEAIASGLPQVASIYNGGARDLVHEDSVGRIIDPLNITQFVGTLEEYIVNCPDRIREELIYMIISYYSPESLSSRALKSINVVLSQ